MFAIGDDEMPGEVDADPGDQSEKDCGLSDAFGVLCVAEGRKDQDAHSNTGQGERERGFEDSVLDESWCGECWQVGGFEDIAWHCWPFMRLAGGLDSVVLFGSDGQRVPVR